MEVSEAEDGRGCLDATREPVSGAARGKRESRGPGVVDGDDGSGATDSSAYGELDSDESEEFSGLLSTYHVKGTDDLYKNLEVLRISDMVSEKCRRNHSNPNFLYAIGGRSNYATVLSDLYIKQKTRNLRKEVGLKLLLEEFFAALDKFVLIANYCLKSKEIEDTDDDFNFALEWVRSAFHWLGIEGAKHYAQKSPGPYSGWVSDVEFLMNRYFFSSEFNHVNGFNIEESVYEGYRFVESNDGKFHLSYLPYPGYYDVGKGAKCFCPECGLMLPQCLEADGTCFLDRADGRDEKESKES